MPRTPQLPVQHWEPELLLQAQDVKVVFFDVDGVLTDGGLLFSGEGEVLKRFHTLDGLGLKMLQQSGITPAVVTGRDSPALRQRLRKLGELQARFGTEDKVPAAREILKELNLDWAQAAAMGDDWPDLPVLQRSSFAAAPANAHPEVLAIADYVTGRNGGEGAVREFCDLLLTAHGAYASLLQKYTI